MIAVIFEAWPAPGEHRRYLDLAAALRPRLDSLDGFMSIERFESLAEPGKLLSLSFWRDEAAVAQWRSGAVAQWRSGEIPESTVLLRARAGTASLQITG